MEKIATIELDSASQEKEGNTVGDSLSEQFVISVLGKTTHDGKTFAQHFHDYLHQAVERTNTTLGSDARIHDQTVKANLAWSFTIDYVKQLATKDLSVRVVGTGRKAKILLDNKLLLKFKKVNSAGGTSNIDTLAVQKFKNQGVIFEGTKVTSIDVMYKLDHLGKNIDKIYFGCPNGKSSYRWRVPDDQLGLVKTTSLFSSTEEEVAPLVAFKPGIVPAQEESSEDQFVSFKKDLTDTNQGLNYEQG